VSDQAGSRGSTWDASVDFVGVGSGGGGLVAALRAAKEGLEALVLEKQDKVGGSTAISGGMVWIPNNPGRFPEEWKETGYVPSADTLEELARMCEIDPAGLVATVEQFNIHARKGEDPEYGRESSEYNRLNGDPANKPNPSLGPIEDGPFHAVQLIPPDVGTCGGLVTDEHGRVLVEGDDPIPGPYATGNTTATIMGRTYMSAGGSIANSMVFGYLAAAHAAGIEGER
jgi:3-oxosteroid 1-dehydrogenase